MTTENHKTTASAMTIREVEGWALGTSAGDDELRVRDLDLATRLGFERPRDIRKIIERHREAGNINDFEVRATVAQTSPLGGRPGTEFWLTEAAALFVATKSETPAAVAITKELIRVFIAARGIPVQRTQELPADVLAGLRAIPVLLNRIEALEAGLAARSAATTDKPTVGTGAARMYVLDPLKEIARIEAQAIGSTDARKRKSLRFAAERRLRQELGFPMGANMRWSNLPSVQLGSACCAVARMHGEAKRFLHVATSKPVKQMLLRLAG